MYNRFRSKKAFTITELVVVIAVIAILAAILIPTFSEVIDNSKKSHDMQLVENLNTALSVYKAETGKAPETYDDLMLALSQQGLTDTTNPFLLATALKQDNMYLIWYENANFVTLISSSDEQYNVSFTADFGLGNGVNVFDKSGQQKSKGYLLCTIGESDGPYIAGVYYDFYVMSGGDITKFQTSFSGKYGDLADKVTDKMWGNTIVAAINNQKLGYTYSETIATDIETQTINSNVISLEMPKVGATIEGGGTVTVEQQAQVMRATMATLSTMSNEDSTAEKLAGKKVVFGEGEDSLKGVEVSFSEVSPTAISATHRDVVTANVPSGFSVDFGGVTITGYELDAQFAPQGAQFQTNDDNNFPNGAYNYSYGLFGTIIVKNGEKVTISNLTIKDVCLDLNGRTITVDGKEGVPTITDSAAVVAGCVLGDAVFENITIDGKQADESNGYIKAYDSPAAIVGRAYSKEGTNPYPVVELKNCNVSNLDIVGQRRAGGLFGIHSDNCTITIDGASLTNVHVSAARNVEGDTAADRKVSIAGIVGGFGVVKSDAQWKDITINGCTCVNNYVPVSGADSTPIWQDGGLYYSKDGTTKYKPSSVYEGANVPGNTGSVPLSNSNFLKLISELSTDNGATFTITNLVIDGVAINKTWTTSPDLKYYAAKVIILTASAN